MKLIAFYKPFGVLCQFTGEGSNLSDFNLPKEVYPAGRLDKDSEGLLLLTDDGTLNQKIANPRANKSKIYHVQVEGIPSLENIKRLQTGIIIKDYVTKPCIAKLLPEMDYPARVPPIRERKQIPTVWLEIQLTEGKNRQVRRMTAAIGHPTLRLIRVQIGAVTLTNLQCGQWTEVPRELAASF